VCACTTGTGAAPVATTGQQPISGRFLSSDVTHKSGSTNRGKYRCHMRLLRRSIGSWHSPLGDRIGDYNHLVAAAPGNSMCTLGRNMCTCRLMQCCRFRYLALWSICSAHSIGIETLVRQILAYSFHVSYQFLSKSSTRSVASTTSTATSGASSNISQAGRSLAALWEVVAIIITGTAASQSSTQVQLQPNCGRTVPRA